MKLYFVRHGESEANVLRIISNREEPHALTSNGRQQARALADSLQGTAFARIFSSPVLRARQTAEILAERLGVPYEVTEALREYDCGILEGKGDAPSWALHQANFHEWLL